jgi:hypothetical protein
MRKYVKCVCTDFLFYIGEVILLVHVKYISLGAVKENYVTDL